MVASESPELIETAANTRKLRATAQHAADDVHRRPGDRSQCVEMMETAALGSTNWGGQAEHHLNRPFSLDAT